MRGRKSDQDKMPKGRTGATAGQKAKKKLTGEPTLEESGSLTLTYTKKEVQVRTKIDERLYRTEDDGWLTGVVRNLTEETW